MQLRTRLQALVSHPSLFLYAIRGYSLNQLEVEYWRRELIFLLKKIRGLDHVFRSPAEPLLQRNVPELAREIVRSLAGKAFPLALYGVMYLLGRAIRPAVVIETGVQYGFSSLALLQMLEDNGSGVLYSIDLPNTDYVTDDGKMSSSPLKGLAMGYAVKGRLRKRWKLLIGDSRDLLPSLVKELSGVEMFVHDSNHSYECLTRELESVWPKITAGGVVMADGVHLTTAFSDFAQRVKGCPITVPRSEDGAKLFAVMMKA